MPGSLLGRLRASLAPDYEVQRELGAGGMGTVFLARDVALDRSVAIKVLLPELATATAAERLLREARILASLSHPNVVPVHRAGEADGLFYYVMDHVEGKTLKQRLARGVMREDEVVKLGSDLLSALQAAHQRGVIHRDIKPGNIFLLDDRVLLGDFGVARAAGEQSPSLTASGQRVGTPAYMPPEQLSGEVTPKSDLYAVGMVLYEAISGRRWPVLTRVEDTDWSNISAHLSRVLRRALAWSPDDRWEDAAAFRDALSGERTGMGSRVSDVAKTAVGAAVVLAAALAAWEIFVGPGDGGPGDGTEVELVSDLAILPGSVFGEWEGGIDGAELAQLVYIKLERVPEIRVVPTRRSIPWWDSASAVMPAERAAAGLHARYAARATLIPSLDGVDLELDVFDSAGDPVPGIPVISFGKVDAAEVGDSVTLRLMKVLVVGDLPKVARLTPDVEALIQFLHGERAFARGAWAPAVSYYEAAVHRDSTFLLAWWRLANAWRWIGQRGPYSKDFRQLFEEHSSELGPLDSMLMAAQLTGPGEERLGKYRQARELFPDNDFAAYLYGEELFNRGPLWGESLESAARALWNAAALNPYWASTYVHLIWAEIRLDHAEHARRALEDLPGIDATPEEGWLYPPALLEQAYRERFEAPEVAAEWLAKIIADPAFGSLESLVPMSRLVASFDLPRTQLVLGEALVEGATDLPHYRASGHVALGLARVALGQGEAALIHFDSAAALFNSPEAALQAAQWRVLPRALGLPEADSVISAGRTRLAALIDDDSVGVRAAWTLALDDYASGDRQGARRWAARLERFAGDEAIAQLRGVLWAVEQAEQGRLEEAIELSDSLLALQAATVLLSGAGPPQTALGDPFARAFLHVRRGEWFRELGDLTAAKREWLWYEAVDMDGNPGAEPPQAGEIDWALGTYGRFLRGRAELELGDRDAACRHLNQVLRLWSEPESTLVDLVRTAEEGAERACL